MSDSEPRPITYRFDVMPKEWTTPWFDSGDMLEEYRKLALAMKAGEMTSAAFGYSDHTNADAPDAPAETCVHPVALMKLTDALATCEGCGRVFALRDFGLPIP